MGVFDIDTDTIPFLYYPKDINELINCINMIIKDHKNDEIINLNSINTSQITDMSYLFYNFRNYNFDISKWDVSNVRNMNNMFSGCSKFNCDLSEWNLCFVKYMDHMFQDCIKFNSDLSKWDLSFVFCKFGIFNNCPIQDHPELQPKF